VPSKRPRGDLFTHPTEPVILSERSESKNLHFRGLARSSFVT
jgi:hypothetical protein